MDSELISVIVCTYNQEDTIGRTLDSILSQKCHLPIEIVIGEDGSTDNTLSVCQQYEKRHPDVIRILAKKQNGGFVRNYFDCLRACRGNFIADCAGDDFWTDNQKLEQESLILEQDENVGIVHTDWLRYDERTGRRTVFTRGRKQGSNFGGHPNAKRTTCHPSLHSPLQKRLDTPGHAGIPAVLRPRCLPMRGHTNRFPPRQDGQSRLSRHTDTRLFQ